MWDAYDLLINTHVDMSVMKNRRIVNQLTEANKLDISDKLVSALYQSAVNKYPEVDFGEITDSKGDITRLKHYETLTETISTIEKIHDSEELKVIKESITVIKAYTKEFCLSYMQDKAMGIMIYNTIVLSIICATNLCISATIDYLKTPGANYAETMKNQKIQEKDKNILFNNLVKFNEQSRKGDLRKIFDSLLKKDNFVGIGTIGVASGVTIAAITLVSAIAIVPIIRELIYFFFNFRMSVSKYFDTQADFLEINIAELKANGNAKAEVVKKQQNRVKTLRDISDTFTLKYKTSEKKTKQDLSKKVQPEALQSSLGNGFTLI